LELILESFDAHLVSDGHEVSLECPLCGDHKPRLFLNLTSCLWTCHNCNESGNLIGFLERVMEKDPFEAYHIASKILPREQRVKVSAQAPVTSIKLPGLPLDNYDDMLQRGFWNYLYGRHIDEHEVAHYQMRYEVIGPYRGRVIIPILLDGQAVSFAARAIVWWEQPKELYPQGTHTSKLVFGLDDVEGDEVILTEGIFDTINLVARGVDAVCTFGAHLADEQRALLHSKGIKKVTVMRDADPAGWKDAAKIARELKSDGFEVKIAGLPKGEDPDSANEDQLQEALDTAFDSRVELPRRSIRTKLQEE
jgi:DNA primase